MRSVFTCLALTAATLAGLAIAYDAFERARLERVTAEVISAIPTEVERTRGALLNEVRSTLDTLDARVAVSAALIDKRLEKMQRDANEHLVTLERIADERSADLIERAEYQVERGIVNLRADLKPLLENAVKVETSADRAIQLWTPQVLGLLAASKVTAGDTAKAAKRIDAALPHLLEKFDRIAANSDRSTEASARLFTNLATATKPLPVWMRLGLAVAPPLAQVSAGVATTLAVTGKFK